MSSFPDARTLLVVVLIITSLAIAMDDPLWLAGLLISTLAILLWLGVSPRRLGGRLRRYRWLFLILALVQSLTNPAGQIYLEWRDYVLLSSGGLLAALAVLLRLATILAAALALTIRNYQELTIALVQLGVPMNWRTWSCWRCASSRCSWMNFASPCWPSNSGAWTWDRFPWPRRCGSIPIS